MEHSSTDREKVKENFKDLLSWSYYFEDIAECASLFPYGNKPFAIYKDKDACKHAHDSLRTKFVNLQEEADQCMKLEWFSPGRNETVVDCHRKGLLESLLE